MSNVSELRQTDCAAAALFSLVLYRSVVISARVKDALRFVAVFSRRISRLEF